MIKRNINMERPSKIFRKTITWNSYLSIYNWIYLSIILLGLKSTTTAQNTSESPPLSIAQQQQKQQQQHQLHTDRLPNCTLVRPQFESRGINSDDIPKESLKAMMLRYCETPQGTCCTHTIETKLAAASRMQLDKQTKETIGKLASVLGSRAAKFNDFFKELLAQSRKEFHDMFKRTYGVIYEQNSYVFSDLFTELEKYYSRGKVDLAEELDSFFNILYQKMFSVLNSQYTFNDKYLGCVSEHMKELKPFGDVPDKLSVQIKRSFVATRTYEQALAAAADVARNMINVRPNAECTAALTKMQQCGLCNGYAVKPCSNYCVNVMKGCLHYYNEMDVEWDNFVSSMEKVSERLLGPFNIVMVVEPINIKISEAIMNFQETGHDISQRVFEGCGRPQLGRRKRSAIQKHQQLNTINSASKIESNGRSSSSNSDTNSKEESFYFSALDEQQKTQKMHDNRKRRYRRASYSDLSNQELKYEPLKFSNSDETSEEADQHKSTTRRNRKKQKQIDTKRKKNDENDNNREPQMDKLVKDIRQKVKDSKKFWSNLPFQICNNDEFTASPAIEENCWNGHTVDRYSHSIVTDGHANPEFQTNTGAIRQSSLIAGQLFTLRNAVGHLRNAYNGLDVEWSDGEESYYGSGSGSGGGIDEDDDDSGSGINSYDYHLRIPDTVDTSKTGINTAKGETVQNTSISIDHDDRHDDNNMNNNIDDKSLSPINPTSSRASRNIYTICFNYNFILIGGIFIYNLL